MNKKFLIIGAVVLVFVVFLAWLFIQSSKPLPGEATLQDGRDHLDEGSKTEYKSNPPTSGNHYASWISKGFYDTPRSDGNLVHSLEHGYVIIWYNCDRKVASDVILRRRESGGLSSAEGSVANPDLIGANATLKQVERFFAPLRMTGEVYAQGVNMTQGSEGSPSASLEEIPESFRNNSCDNLKKQLKDVYQKLGPHKLIIVPRVGMDHPIILTAWGRIEKLDTVDQNKIKQFIDAFRDAGPEATNEP